jgi:hypothetical protein
MIGYRQASFGDRWLLECLLMVTILLTSQSIGFSQTITVTPSAGGRFSSPVETNVLVQYATPPGWHRLGDRFGFVPDASKDVPIVELQVLARVDSTELAQYKKGHPEWTPSPKYTFAYESLRESSHIKSIEKVASFDGGQNGRLNLWHLDGDSYDVYIILIVDDHVTVELNLRCDDPKVVKQYLKVLKEEARSIQIIRHNE